MKDRLLKRFLKYISIDTKSNPNSKDYPSTKGQLTLGEILYNECKEIGLTNVVHNKYGYVTGTLKSNIDKKVPTVAFFAHMDTSPDFSGENINPQIINNYDGEDIKLNSDMVLSVKEFPILKNYKGETLITTDGTTLLGADNKAGVAEILTAIEYLINNNNIPHGDIKIAFTPDEEIGCGVNYFNVKEFGADYAFTIDGGELGELEYENFNAASGKIKVTGKSIHPGSSKNLMINASLLVNEFINMLPPSETPSTTENYEGFYHITNVSSSVSEGVVELIIRDFFEDTFNDKKEYLENLITFLNKKYDNRFKLEIKDEYSNMSKIINENKFIINIGKKAYENLNIIPIIKPIRGGTDGARLSYTGLPCPNIFTGGHNFHGPYEFAHVESMLKAVNVIIEISKLNAQED